MKKLLPLIVLAVFLASSAMVSAGEYTGKPIQAKLASEEIEGD